ncbi:MAG: galactokinase [Phycisphaerales bacterium]|nr:MAG: galactokinase [Phycisphaerales bacterium]
MRRSPSQLIGQAATTFRARFGGGPVACGVAPGRVEILGNHTDYNGGAVLTAAIDRYVVAVGRPMARRCVRVHSAKLDRDAEIDLEVLTRDARPDWSSYVKSVFTVLGAAGVEPGGMEVVIASGVPIGAGLSSSAALEAALAMLVLCVRSATIDSVELARLLQRGENEYVGVRCGLLDQFSSLHGQADRLIFLDCTTCEHETLSLGSPAPAIVVVDSRVSREFVGNQAPYNLRREECELAAERLSRALGRTLTGLCRASSEELERYASDIPEPALSRARHVIGEHERVLAARVALKSGDVTRLGALMGESHGSSRRYFDNSCDALDQLCELAAGQGGLIGGRLCGGGWGGCTVNLVESGAVESFVAGMKRAVATLPEPTPQVHVCYASDGASGCML